MVVKRMWGGCFEVIGVKWVEEFGVLIFFD